MEHQKVYYPGLDALRGIAILLVIVYHYFYFFRIGWIGVDLFFVLSGFLITTILLKTRYKERYFKNFFLRRILRIFPVYFLALITFYLLAPIVFSQKQPGSVYAYYHDNQIWFWTFTQNWLFIKGQPPAAFLQHFWSVAIEEQFYLVWPFIIYSIRNLFLLKYVLAALFFFALIARFILWFHPVGNEAFFYNTFARMDSLAAGALLGVFHIQGIRISKIQSRIALISFAVVLIISLFIFKNLNHNNAIFATVVIPSVLCFL